jgi:hypothetical protein
MKYLPGRKNALTAGSCLTGLNLKMERLARSALAQGEKSAVRLRMVQCQIIDWEDNEECLTGRRL